MKAREHGAQAHGLFSCRARSQFFFGRLGNQANAQRECDGEDGYGDGDGVDSLRAALEIMFKGGIGDSSDGRAGDGCDLEGAGVPGDCVQEMLFWNEVRQDGSAYGEAEGAHDSDQHEDDVDGVRTD